MQLTPRPDTEARPRLSSHREHVVIIESCSITSAIAARALEEHGYRVTVMEKAEEALQLMLAPSLTRPYLADLVLLDTDKEDIDAATFSAVMRSVISEVPPLVLLGGRSDEEMNDLADRGGAVAYVAKPLDVDDLLITVRRSFRRARPQPQPSFFDAILRPAETRLLS